MNQVLITDDVHPLLIEGLEADGWHCVYQPDITLDRVREVIGNYQGLIINSKILVDRQLLDSASTLRFVGRVGSGMEIVDRIYAREKGVAVLSSPEGNCNAVAEQALGMLLALANNLLRSDREVRQKNWQREKNRGFEIMGRTVGIIGFGHTGSAFAAKLAGMGVRVLAYDKYKPAGYAADFPHVTETDFAAVHSDADIISFHLPLTAETRHLAGESFLQNCRDGVIIINTSRGQVVHTEALVKALESGKVLGACLDVFENEKTGTFTPAEHALYDRLYALEQVVLSPHIAGWTHESKYKLAAILLERIRKALKVPDTLSC